MCLYYIVTFINKSLPGPHLNISHHWFPLCLIIKKAFCREQGQMLLLAVSNVCTLENWWLTMLFCINTCFFPYTPTSCSQNASTFRLHFAIWCRPLCPFLSLCQKSTRKHMSHQAGTVHNSFVFPMFSDEVLCKVQLTSRNSLHCCLIVPIPAYPAPWQHTRHFIQHHTFKKKQKEQPFLFI